MFTRGREKLCKLLEAKGCQDSGNVRIMGEIEIQSLIKRECYGIVVQCDVGLSIGVEEKVVLQTRQELLDVANPHSSARRRLEIVIAGKAEVDRVLESLPFFVGEEITPGRVSECHCFVGAEGLSARFSSVSRTLLHRVTRHSLKSLTTQWKTSPRRSQTPQTVPFRRHILVHAGDIPSEARRQGLQALGSVYQVLLLPYHACVGSPLTDCQIRIVAVVVAR